MTVAAAIHLRILDTRAFCRCSALIYCVSLISSGRVSLEFLTVLMLLDFELPPPLVSVCIKEWVLFLAVSSEVASLETGLLAGISLWDLAVGDFSDRLEWSSKAVEAAEEGVGLLKGMENLVAAVSVTFAVSSFSSLKVHGV